MCDSNRRGSSPGHVYILRNTVFLFGTVAYSFLTDCVLKGLAFYRVYEYSESHQNQFRPLPHASRPICLACLMFLALWWEMPVEKTMFPVWLGGTCWCLCCPGGKFHPQGVLERKRESMRDQALPAWGSAIGSEASGPLFRMLTQQGRQKGSCHQ